MNFGNMRSSEIENREKENGLFPIRYIGEKRVSFYREVELNRWKVKCKKDHELCRNC